MRTKLLKEFYTVHWHEIYIEVTGGQIKNRRLCIYKYTWIFIKARVSYIKISFYKRGIFGCLSATGVFSIGGVSRPSARSCLQFIFWLLSCFSCPEKRIRKQFLWPTLLKSQCRCVSVHSPGWKFQQFIVHLYLKLNFDKFRVLFRRPKRGVQEKKEKKIVIINKSGVSCTGFWTRTKSTHLK